MAESDPSNVALLEIYGGAIVASGSFLYFHSGTICFREGLEVAQIIDIQEKRDIACNERTAMYPLQESRRRNTRSSINANILEDANSEIDRTKFILLRTMEVVKDAVRPPREQCDNVHDSTQEVIMTCSLKWYPLEQISSCAAIAFVHHLESIQDGDWPCSGQVNTFFIQQRRLHGGTLVLIKKAKFNPFYSPHSFKTESYAMRISNFICSLTEKCFKLLTGSKATHDCRSKHLHLAGSNFEAYLYIEAMSTLVLKEAAMPPQRSNWCSSRARKELNCDLSVSNKRRKLLTDVHRYTLRSQLCSLRLVLGSTFGIGPLLVVPTMKAIRTGKSSSTVRLRTTDDVRIVSCIEDDEAVDYNPTMTLRKRLDHEGVDLKFHRCGSTTDFHVHFIYSRDKGSCSLSSIEGSVEGGVDDAIDDAIDFDDDAIDFDDTENVNPKSKEQPSIHVNAEFNFKGELRVVTAVDREKQKIKHRHVIDDSDVDSLSLDLNIAAQKIQ